MKNINHVIAVRELQLLVRLDPQEGYIYWRERPVPDGPPVARTMALRFNAMWAGKRTLCQRHYKGYLHGDLLGQNFRAHRVAYALHHGEWPVGEIDHINGDRADNRPENLRDVSSRENNRNRRLMPTNKSGRVGVIQVADKWQAYITIDYRNIHLGTFVTFAEASAARQAGEKLAGFHQNHGKALAA